MYVCTYLVGDVGGDRVGGAVLGGRQVAEGLKGGMLFVLEALNTMVCVHLDLVVTGVCSQGRAGSCVSSCARLQWVERGGHRGQWRDILHS